MHDKLISELLNLSDAGDRMRKLVLCAQFNRRISVADAVFLYHNAPLPLLGMLAHHRRKQLNGDKAFFIKNIHIEYTNICVNRCAFCSFRSRNAADAWEMTLDEIIERIRTAHKEGISEVHLVGGIHPDKNLYFWLHVLQAIRAHFPDLHIKAFTAAEIDYMTQKAGVSITQGLEMLRNSGLGSIPGGGAEIFDENIRLRLFPGKTDAAKWLRIHRLAHKQGIPSNATMLYGHIETVEQRFRHLEKLRHLQDHSGGFNAFIPLKYKNKNNELKGINETTLTEDLKMFALSRIFLDNFPHIKAYWPMLGRDAAFMALDFGADDMDGTINNSTAIYSKAGASEQNPDLSETGIVHLIRSHRKTPVERDALYNTIKEYPKA